MRRRNRNKNYDSWNKNFGPRNKNFSLKCKNNHFYVEDETNS